MSTCKQFAGLLLLTTALNVPTALWAQGVGGAPSSAPASIPPVTPSTDTRTPTQPDLDDSVPGQITGVDEPQADEQYDDPDSSTQVISVLSTEQIARTGEGDIAGALSRVTGLSLQGNGLVYVRGLGDRYSLALLNGLPLPSPQPLSRVVPLDIFPTSIIASSLVQKTYSANFPGEFGGGVINLTTRAVPEESFLTIGAGLSGDTESTFQNGLSYYGADSDWTGFDDGTRDLPRPLTDFFATGERLDNLSQTDNETVGKSLLNANFVTLQKIGDLPANWSASVSGGAGIDVGSDGRFGIIASASYGNRWRNRVISRQTGFGSVDTPDLTVATDFTDFVTDDRVTVNGLLGLGLEIGEHRFRFTNVYIRDTQKLASLAQGEVIISSTGAFSQQNQDTAWYERQLIDSQLVGELRFGDLDIDLRGGYARTDREAPYEYRFTYVRTNAPTDPYGSYFANLLDGTRGDADVAFSDLQETLWYGGIDLSYQLMSKLRATVGYAYTDTDRYSERRQFQFQSQGLANSSLKAIGLFQPRYLLQPSVFDYRAVAQANNAANPDNPQLPIYSIVTRELTQINPAFDAALRIHAGYGQIDYDPVDALSINLGVRYEDGKQTVDPAILFNMPVNLGASTSISNDYFLPAATITLRATEDLQLRLSASRTIARPQFRELIFQPYTDPETTRDYIGNPELQDSELINAEARAEYYLPNRSRVSVAGFYKHIDRPIEPYSQFSDNNQTIFYANAPAAQLYGGEFELAYNYDLLDFGGILSTKQLVAIANYTYTQSKLQVDDGDTTRIFGNNPIEQPASVFFIDGAPLTGQSDHLVNLQLGLEDTEVLQQITFLLSYASDRVTSRGGGNNLPDVIEDPGFRFDMVVRQGFPLLGTNAELKLEGRNLLGRGHLEYQSKGTNRLDINTYDVGTTLAASLAVTF